jgi:hypothetical protein
MSIYACLSCHDCRQSIFLGKALHENGRPTYFHRGRETDLPNWRREQLNQVLCKFLADHAGYRIDVRTEAAMTDDMNEYAEVGGDLTKGDGKDISFERYLRGWAGLGSAADRDGG